MSGITEPVAVLVIGGVLLLVGVGADEVGLRVEIYAVLVDADVADYLASIDSGSEEPWFSTALPGIAVDSITVERNSIRTPCR